MREVSEKEEEDDKRSSQSFVDLYLLFVLLSTSATGLSDRDW